MKSNGRNGTDKNRNNNRWWNCRVRHFVCLGSDNDCDKNYDTDVSLTKLQTTCRTMNCMFRNKLYGAISTKLSLYCAMDNKQGTKKENTRGVKRRSKLDRIKVLWENVQAFNLTDRLIINEEYKQRSKMSDSRLAKQVWKCKRVGTYCVRWHWIPFSNRL